MNIDREFKQVLKEEFKDQVTNLIWKNDQGDYCVFDKYIIKAEKTSYRVYCHATDVGLFGTTKAALSWCIADKYKIYSLARDILNLDTKLTSLTKDIFARAQVADSSKNPQFREVIETKLETKIIHKKTVETELSKCIKMAKYYQQKGFNQNEIIRTQRTKAK